MAQFDVFVNPAPRARSGYPYVVTLQSDLLTGSLSQIVAPLTAPGAGPPIARRILPEVQIDGSYYRILPALYSIPARVLGGPITSLVSARPEILVAIDFVFTGF